MIIAGGKTSGKRLVNAIIQDIKKDGYAEVAILSESGIQRFNRAAQTVADTMATKVNVDPRNGEVQLDSSTFRAALILKLSIEEEQHNG